MGFVNQQASLGGTILGITKNNAGSRNATKAWNDANWIGVTWGKLTVSYGLNNPFIVDLPIEHGDFL
jgi:hypothetical protein